MGKKRKFVVYFEPDCNEIWGGELIEKVLKECPDIKYKRKRERNYKRENIVTGAYQANGSHL